MVSVKQSAIQQTMLDIAKAILDAAKALLGLADQLNAADRQQRTDMADLFDKISTCLAATSSEIRAGGVPHGRCGELMMYADSLPPLAEGALGEEKAKALGVQLHSAYAVERLAAQIAEAADQEPHLAAWRMHPERFAPWATCCAPEAELGPFSDSS